MTYAALFCSDINPYYDPDLPRGMVIATITFDTLLSLTLLVVGTLAIIAGAAALPLGGIGAIGVGGGGAMVAIGLLIALVDIAVPCCLKTGKAQKDFHPGQMPSSIGKGNYQTGTRRP